MCLCHVKELQCFSINDRLKVGLLLNFYSNWDFIETLKQTGVETWGLELTPLWLDSDLTFYSDPTIQIDSQSTLNFFFFNNLYFNNFI